MDTKNCAVVGCTNSTQKLTKQKEFDGQIDTNAKHKVCGCQPSF